MYNFTSLTSANFSGGRGYYLMGPAVFLQQGLIQLALQVPLTHSFWTFLFLQIFSQVTNELRCFTAKAIHHFILHSS